MASRTIPQMKANLDALVVKLLRDPVTAVWRLHGGDYAATIAVLIEQCAFDVDSLTKAIMNAMGGWKFFESGSVVAEMPEGYVVVPTNDEAREYMDLLYAASFDGEMGDSGI